MKIKGIITITCCFIGSVLLLWLCNCLWDSRYTFGLGDGSTIYAALSKKLVSKPTQIIEDIFPVNISYDRELVPVTDTNGIPIGDIDIADRKKLLALLSYLNEYSNYRYIVCDIAFNGKYKTETDSLLFGLIASMPNIVVPEETEVLPDVMREISAPSGYKVFHHGSPFLKYCFRVDGKRTIPLKMWYDQTGDDLVRHWWGFSLGDRWCNNAAFLDLTNIVDYSNQTLKTINGSIEMEEKLVYHLGSDLLSEDCPKELFDDKIVLIGDFYERDMHDTAVGQVPGVMLLYAAYRSLAEGRNRIPTICLIILIFLFFACLMLIFYYGGWKINNPLLAYLIDSVSFAFPFELFNFLTIYSSGYSVNAVLIGLLFGFISYLKKLPRRHAQ